MDEHSAGLMRRRLFTPHSWALAGVELRRRRIRLAADENAGAR
jgi:hypothetical protein